VGVTALWHASTIGTLSGQHITIDYRDMPEGIRQDPGGEKTPHARAEDHRMFADSAHH